MNFLNDISIATVGSKNETDSNMNTYNHNKSEIINIETKYAGKIKKLIKALGGINYKHLPDTSDLTKLIFRGFQIDYNEEELPEYFHNFFIVGEKGPFYRNQLFSVGEEIDSNNFYTAATTNTDLDELMDEINDILTETSKKKYKISKRDLGLLKDKGYSNKDIHMFLLNWSHNIGSKWGNKPHSPFVSTSYGKTGFDTAVRFSKGNGHQTGDSSYVLIGYLKQDDKENLSYTTKMTKILKELNIDWYEDTHSEIIIKDAIFPQYIIGVIEIVNNNRTLVINPYLYNLFNSDFSLKEILELLINCSIPVNQEAFNESAEQMGYEGYGYDDGENRYMGRIGRAASIQLPNNYF